MSTVCPKCRYGRRPSDQAPAWQCPSCGVAYAKVAGASPSTPPTGFAPSLAGAASRSSGLRWGRLLLAVTVAAGVWLASRAGLHF